MVICVAIIAGGPTLLMYKDEIVKWLASKGYKCPKCGHEDWVGVSDDYISSVDRGAKSKINTNKLVDVGGAAKVNESFESAKQNIEPKKINKPRFKYIDKSLPFQWARVTIDNVKQIENLKLLAKVNNGAAENKLAQLYYEGKDIEQDYKESYFWANISAQKDNQSSQNLLSILYRNGWGVEKNYETSEFWFKKANLSNQSKFKINIDLTKELIVDPKQLSEIRELSKKDDGSVENRLGQIYYSGIKTNQNYSRAFKWSKVSAEKGNKDAQIRLSNLYRNGWGVVRNKELAIFWLEKSKSIVISESKEIAKINWCDISDLKQFNEIRLLANSNDGSAENLIGHIFYGGIKTKKNYVKAFDYSKLAAEQGIKDAQLRLFFLYKYGHGTPRDEKLAEFWLDKYREK
ncbi:sel1 repeat family protein [Acinetobacter cumulans]|uniref:Sel1 repeat family protein n=2 Tax=Acinetobacter cumulans TaxID=2136182 RepID=A0A498DAR4_9GAMM|nr:sel1 repeat family protein [Acinetobacter cumulans]